ncbi:MAG: hypothetical protein RL410_150 [Actinomycetota bacterium]|jgi:putative ABC transport system ATP-binding protein
MSENIYELTAVDKSFRTRKGLVHALTDVDLKIQRGALVTIQGPTGGGKSTLLQLLGGLDQPSAGSIMIDDVEATNMSEKELADLRANKVGFVFQSFNLIPTLTTHENVEAALIPLNVSSAERKSRVNTALEAVGLTDRATHLPGELSGGQQQRVAIARALVKNPTVILADEPTGNLDEQTRDDIMGLLENLNKNQGLTLIIVTHDSHVAKRAEVRLQIREGRVTVDA